MNPKYARQNLWNQSHTAIKYDEVYWNDSHSRDWITSNSSHAVYRIVCSEAYSVLSKPEEREAYNFKLEQALRDEDDDFTGAFLSSKH